MSYVTSTKDVEYIREISDRALDLMSQYNVIPTPSNYQVWYSYVGESDMSLTALINDMRKNKKSFTSEVCNNLYEKFFSADQIQKSLKTAGQGIQTELLKIAKTVGDMNKGTVAYGASLVEGMKDLGGFPGGAELKTVLSQILQETNEIARKNTIAKNQLKESAQTVRNLQTTLEAVRREALTDMLTNIGNRKSFEENLYSNIAEANETKSDLCLIIGDIDYFKKFNDAWGHHVGDQVLKSVAHTINTRVGDLGTTARYGGEEFVILLPGLSLEEAHKLSDSIRQAISQRTMKRKSTGESIGKITCSFGIAKYRFGENRQEFVERADAALYLSKGNGRNRITTEEDVSQPIRRIA